ncbi:MAG: hypothetical protein JWQ50_7459 [Caballeronia mineralivorans]|jgi:hypothetical protein|nr:hypothetical protein [Caballeronia mineralivorans]MEA3105319.1 hypothetical protein [Caballeronia mineralivorans]
MLKMLIAAVIQEPVPNRQFLRPHPTDYPFGWCAPIVDLPF